MTAVPSAAADPAAAADPSAAAGRRSAAPPDGARADLLVAGAAMLGLAVLGALLGLVWAWWSPTGPPAVLYPSGAVAVLGETESFVAGDGRFLVLGAAVGSAAALGGWYLRRANRGPVVLAALVVGGVAGALLTELVGHLTGGGSLRGKAYRLSDGSTAQVTLHLPLSLHMQGLLLVEPALAALLFGLLVGFTAHDDLGRPDPVRDAIRGSRSSGRLDGAGQQPEGSVGPGAEPQHGWGHGDAPGAAQQSQFPPQ